MSRQVLIKKASGEFVPFSKEKLATSLERSGASDETVSLVLKDIESWVVEGTTTAKLYRRAFMLLRRYQKFTAARYSLKNALMELGPTGYAFEKLMGHVFRAMGFSVEVGIEVEGKCVTHEVDVLATNHKHQHFVECKFYNSPGKSANVQVPLYIRSRVNDIIDKRRTQQQYKDFVFHGWVATNTRFTSDAQSFGECSGLNLISWDYPENRSLKRLVEDNQLFPITALTNLTKAEKEKLLSDGVVLCKEINDNPELLKILDLKPAKLKQVLYEVKDLSVKK